MRTFRIRWPVVLLVVCGWARAQDPASMDGVTRAKDVLWLTREGKTAPLAADTSLPFGVSVSTNGTYTVDKSKPRRLLEGQVLRTDGNLLNPDGTLLPVFNHFSMSMGKVLEVVDGVPTPLAGPRNLPDGSTLHPNGIQVLPGGRRVQLVDGQLLKPDGSWLPVKDTVSLKNGKVWLQRDGARYALQSFQITTLSDGTRVQGDGTVTLPNGKTLRLKENQTILVDGVAVKR